MFSSLSCARTGIGRVARRNANKTDQRRINTAAPAHDHRPPDQYRSLSDDAPQADATTELRTACDQQAVGCQSGIVLHGFWIWIRPRPLLAAPIIDHETSGAADSAGQLEACSHSIGRQVACHPEDLLAV